MVDVDKQDRAPQPEVAVVPRRRGSQRVPAAWLLARVEFPGRRVLRALVTVPLVLPPVVGGVALLLVFGRRGILGGWLYAAVGFTLPFTTAGVVVAESF